MDRSEITRMVSRHRTAFCSRVRCAVEELRQHMLLYREYPNFVGMQRHDLEQARIMLSEMLDGDPVRGLRVSAPCEPEGAQGDDGAVHEAPARLAG